MKSPLLDSLLLKATRLTQAGRLTEATAALQRRLAGHASDRVADAAGDAKETLTPPQAPPETAPARQTLRGLLDPLRRGGLPLPGSWAPQPPAPVPAAADAPVNGQFLSATFSNAQGSRPYRLYVPSGYHGQLVPLIVMLHGCTQSPEDFATGTRMNEAAEAATCLVAYPAQTSAANPQKCWNWFRTADQQREQGEPALIAGITQDIMRDYAVDPARVYAAGLSAGGAAAAIMGDAYPDLYAAIGVHSGLACGAARDMPSAFTAMQRGAAGGARSGSLQHLVPAIIFHGERDTTVNPRNGEAVVEQSAQGATLRQRAEDGRIADGHSYRRTLHIDTSGRTVIEQWQVHDAGHAWFGGSPAGSYTDPRGPDATREMLRFFLEHPRPAPMRHA